MMFSDFNNRRITELLAGTMAVVGVADPGKAEEPELNLQELEQRANSLESEIFKVQREYVRKAYDNITEDPDDNSLSYQILSFFADAPVIKDAVGYGINGTRFVNDLMVDPRFHAYNAAIKDINITLAIYRTDSDLLEQHRKGEIDLGYRLEFVKRRLKAVNGLIDAQKRYLLDIHDDEDLGILEEEVKLAQEYILTSDDELGKELSVRMQSRIWHSLAFQNYVRNAAGQDTDSAINMPITERILNERNDVGIVGRLMEEQGLSDKKKALKHHNDGNSHFESKNYGVALIEQKMASELDPLNPQYHYSVGVNLSHLGRFEEAVLEHKRSIGLDPFYCEPYHGAVVALSNLNRFVEALPYARVYLTIGDNSDAIKEVKHFIELVGSNQK